MINMKLEQQCVSLELARQLKELGFEQKSFFSWWEKFEPPFTNTEFKISQEHPWSFNCNVNKISAFTTAELGEMLPASFSITIDSVQYKAKLSIDKLENGTWSVKYKLHSYDKFPKALVTISDKKLVDAMAKMLIYLKENNLI